MGLFGGGLGAIGRGGSVPGRLLRRAVVLAFAVIQLVLVARMVLDLGVIPEEGRWADLITTASDGLAAPVEGIGSGLGAFGGGGTEMVAGEGLNAVIVSALIGWSVVEGLVMRVVRKFEQV